jgi:nitrite reductase/ring-hydroxylating ferredoxin subunit
MAWISLCYVSELIEGRGKYVEIDGFQLAVFLHEGHVHVIDNTCPHAGGNLSGGHVEDGCAVCPLHQWAFRLESGELRDSPVVMVRTYRTRLIQHEAKQLVQADLPVW